MQTYVELVKNIDGKKRVALVFETYNLVFNVFRVHAEFLLHSSVTVKPTIVRGPSDAIVQENSDVVFRCTASGEPEPTTAWRKEKGVIPAHR